MSEDREPDNDDDLTEKLVGIALKEGTKVVAELAKSKILGFEDEENPLRYGTVRSMELIKPTGNPIDEVYDDDEVDERLENLTVDNISASFDDLTIGEIRELLKQLPPYLRRGRKVSGYTIYLGRCLTGSKLEPDITASEHITQCNLSWRDLPETEKELYRGIATEQNEGI